MFEHLKITSEIIGATTFGVGGIISAWYAGRAMLKKTINNGDDPLERRKNSITREEHILCRETRENVEAKLFEGQEKIEGKMETMRTENRADFGKVFDQLKEVSNGMSRLKGSHDK